MAHRTIRVSPITLGLALLLSIALNPATTSVAAQGKPAATVPAGLRTRIEAALPPGTGRGMPRFTLITLDANGNLTVIYKVEAASTLAALRNAAVADELAILRAVFIPAQNPHIRSATIVGTYAISKGTSTRELPIVLATLSVGRAGRIDWATVRPNQLAGLVDVWWLHPALTSMPATPTASPMASPIGG